MRTFKVTKAANILVSVLRMSEVDSVTVILLVVGWTVSAKALDSKLWKWITMRWQHGTVKSFVLFGPWKIDGGRQGVCDNCTFSLLL